MFSVAVDKKMADAFYSLSPFFNLLRMDKPFEISRNASMTDSVVASTSEWITRQQQPHTPS